jgi:hypothetical protein
MTRNIFRAVAALGCVLALYGCGAQTRFEWGSYESSLYSYYKDSGQRTAYEASLVKAIDAGKKSNKVAPGLYAELGYMRLEDGDAAQAQTDFDEEMKLFPESRAFLTGVAKRITPTNAVAKGPTS